MVVVVVCFNPCFVVPFKTVFAFAFGFTVFGFAFGLTVFAFGLAFTFGFIVAFCCMFPSLWVGVPAAERLNGVSSTAALHHRAVASHHGP